jgi:hypothetical protein
MLLSGLPNWLNRHSGDFREGKEAKGENFQKIRLTLAPAG